MINPWREQSKVNPQRKPNRQINNEIWHALTRACLTGGEYQVILTILDRSWGFGSLSALISLKRFEESTKLTRQGIIKALKRAEERHLIVCRREGTKTTEYLFNKHYDTWIMPASQLEFTSEEESQLVNQSLLDKSTAVYQTSQLPEPTTVPVKKLIKETLKEKNDLFDIEKVTLSIELKKIIAYYFKAYREHTGEPHPNLKPEQWDRVGAELEAFRAEYGVSDFPAFQTIIDYHFQRRLKTDYNINHFATPGVLENLFYKNLY